MDPEHGSPAQLPAAPFPTPPPFWKHFTTENEKRLSAIESDKTEDSKQLPIELAVLKPPQPPSETATSFTVFSIPQSLSAVPAPPPPEILLFDPKSSTLNPASLLTRLTKSLLLNFLELITILGNDPTQYADKLSDVNRLMLNVHFVINMYRPHQAREGVKEMLEGRLQDGIMEIEKCDEMMERVKNFLHTVEQSADNSIAASNEEHALQDENYKRDQNIRLWSLIDAYD